MKVNVYLNFNGNTEEAFVFYKSVFKKEFQSIQRFGETGYGEGMTAEDKEKIMHVALPISEGYVLMGSDTLESQGHVFKQGNNFSISLSPSTEEEAEEFFHALSVNGTITMSLQKTFWNAYFGMVTDQFGVQWMVNYEG